MRVLFSAPPDCDPRPAIFLDRDGVINERVVDGYVTKWEEFRFIKGMPEAVSSLARLDLPILVVSNQACVGKGLLDEPQLERITRAFVAALEMAGDRVDGVYYCPHRSDERCSCRKPMPGLLQQASRDWRVDLGRSVLVGDSLTDLEAASTVNCRAVLFNGAPGLLEKVTGLLMASQSVC
jgi:D-glycero-D-manno-heptose 1,7-bisphosphate phosphatase